MQKPDITQNHRLATHLMIEIKAERSCFSKSGFETLDTVLRELARDKIITINYSGTQPTGIHLKQSHRAPAK